MSESIGLRLTGYRAVPAEGARIGLVSCLECGAALVIDPDDTNHGINVIGLHAQWHARQEPTS